MTNATSESLLPPRQKTHAKRVLGAALGLAFAGLATQAGAQPVEIPATWGGDLATRPRLTGDWGGARDDLGRRGIVFDVDLLSTPQAVLGGGARTGAYYWGTATYTINLDTGKAGLWPGGFFKIQASSGFGSSISRAASTIVPVNTALLSPSLSGPATGLEHLTFTQFLSPKFGGFFGKIYTLDAAKGEFAGDARTQFMNTALTLPMASALVPISAFGGGLIALPSENLIFSAIAIDPSGTVLDNDLGSAFSDGVMLIANGKLTVRPFGLLGHQTITGIWSDKSRVSLVQDPSNLGRMLLTSKFPALADPGPLLNRILERHFPGLLVPVQPANRESSTWAITYGFDQYIWQPAGDSKRGIGIFFNFGASDGRANPVAYSFNVGIGAKGIIPGRPDDNLGIGWARTQFSDNFAPFLRERLSLGLEREDVVEMYYNAAVTPWMNVGLDLQVIKPGLSRLPNAGGSVGEGNLLRSSQTTVVGGLRLQARF